MMVRWKNADLSETTIDGLSEVTLISHGGLDDDLLGEFKSTLKADSTLPEWCYSRRETLRPSLHSFDDMKESRILVLTRSSKKAEIPTIWDINCSMAWILDDNGNTIDRLCCK